MNIGDRVSGILRYEPDNDSSYSKGDRVHGWIAEMPMPGVYSSAKEIIVIEPDPKYGAMTHSLATVGRYAKKRRGDHFVLVDHVRPIRAWKRGVPENTGYKLHKARKKGSVRIGDLWITPVQEDDSVL